MTLDNLNIALGKSGELITSKFKDIISEQDFNSSGDLLRSVKYKAEITKLTIFAKEYAGALSKGISTGSSGDVAGGKLLKSNLIEWAKSKGMRPNFRTKGGQFKKVTENSWNKLGFVLSRSLREKGISKRFGYQGSGFIKTVQDQTEVKIMDIIMKGFKKDLIIELNKRK